MNNSVRITTEFGESIAVQLSSEGDRELGKVIIDGVPYHIERIQAASLKREYRVDRDKDYMPQHNQHGMCVIVAPYSKK